jgi:hypothetical protein
MATRQVQTRHKEATAAQEIQTLLVVAVAHQPLVQMQLPERAEMAVVALHLALVEAVLPMQVVGAAEPKVAPAESADLAAVEMAQLALHIQHPNLELQIVAVAAAAEKIQIKRLPPAVLA